MAQISETRITATELSRNLAEILDRVRHAGERFIVERDGEAVAVIEPPVKRFTLRDLVELRARFELDEDFADDLEAIQAEQPLATWHEWPD